MKKILRYLMLSMVTLIIMSGCSEKTQNNKIKPEEKTREEKLKEDMEKLKVLQEKRQIVFDFHKKNNHSKEEIDEMFELLSTMNWEEYKEKTGDNGEQLLNWMKRQKGFSIENYINFIKISTNINEDLSSAYGEVLIHFFEKETIKVIYAIQNEENKKEKIMEILAIEFKKFKTSEAINKLEGMKNSLEGINEINNSALEIIKELLEKIKK